MASTAIASIVSPAATPAATGIAPIAACTVAFGMYAAMQNTFSFRLRSVLLRESRTPRLLTISPTMITASPRRPTWNMSLTSTCAPTRTKRSISANIHTLLNFSDNLRPVSGILSRMTSPTTMTPTRAAIGRWVLIRSPIFLSRMAAPRTMSVFSVFLISNLLKRYTRPRPRVRPAISPRQYR